MEDNKVRGVMRYVYKKECNHQKTLYGSIGLTNKTKPDDNERR